MKFFHPLDNPQIRVISLGAGVQSSVLALMADQKLLGPRPDVAIFADTGWEPQGVYDHLEWLTNMLTIPVEIVSAGDIKDDILHAERFASIPFFTGSGGIGRRQCTREYKIDPIQKRVRELLGLKPRQRNPKEKIVEMMIGISRDEIQRVKESRWEYMHHRFPLIEQKMTREDCKQWFAERYPDRHLPRSACIGCPYHTDHEWRHMRDNDPDSWAEALEFDDAVRDSPKRKGMEDQVFLHRQRIPLREVDLSTPEDHGQLSFLDECEGMCGL
jgi:hypothetical protein